MKLEHQLIHSFIIPYITGIILCAAMVISSSIYFTNKYIDRTTGGNIIEIEKKNSKVNIDSVNILITTNLLKVQSALNELIVYYQNLANELINQKISAEDINETFFKAAFDIVNDKNFFKENKDLSQYMTYWILDHGINLSKLAIDSVERKQLKVLSNMTHNLFSTFSSINLTCVDFYFYFDSTEIFIGTPLSYFNEIDFFDVAFNFTQNAIWCSDENGKVYTYYKAKCRSFYYNSQKAKTDIFDYNHKDNMNRTIFVTDFYYQVGDLYGNVYTICIQFTDPISNTNAFICADINQTSLIYNLDYFNKKLIGYYFIIPVGFNNVFYFPSKTENAQTPGRSIFNWEDGYSLEEKNYFNNHIQKLMSSNYIKYIIDSLFDEIYINGNNTENQYFSFNKEIYNFSIYPVVLDNLKGEREHVLNIVYVYNKNNFFDRMEIDINIGVEVVTISIIFLVFGSGLLYIVILTFNILSKYIVIPIKNVNYMLKGINIGGENRLDYLSFLDKKQDENVELLEKYLNFDKNIKKENNEENDNNNNNTDDKVNDENQKDEENINEEENLERNTQEQNDTDYNDELIESKVDYNKKFDEDNEFIQKESNFYDFDEQLLRFRPLEIDRLINALIDLKKALILTSSDQPVEQIIQYSNSENIFNTFKNKEGATICQSNIGNLQSKLSKYDTAIYHLAKSLEDVRLKKFFSRNLSEELDENDSLLNRISQNYNLTKKKERMNLLMLKQLGNTKDNFSQKIIGILINSRYTRLIHAYYKFFSAIQKSNIEILSRQFMNTSFHKINYYHKILIQFIYLSFIKNDLIKIGESILDYIEFLLKFKFKTSKDNKYVLNRVYFEGQEIKRKKTYKKNIFDKIMNWINLFDDYTSYIRDNTSLGDDKNILEDLTPGLNSESSAGNQSLFLFKVNVQRGEYLKGKFALTCKNYNDALYYFIRASKKKSIVIDGLIKKKSLKRINKILYKLFKKYEKYGIIRWQMEEKITEYEKVKTRFLVKRYSFSYVNKPESDIFTNENNKATFKQEMEEIKSEIVAEINECNAKQAKDIIIIIDFNKYYQDMSSMINTDKIDAFIDQTKTIIEKYLSGNDRLCTFIYNTQYQIICPLLIKNDIDINSFSQDLIYYKKKAFNEEEESEEDENIQNETEKLGMKLDKGNNISDSESDESIKGEEKCIKVNELVKGLINTVNYANKYLRMKDERKNEKYVILFTDLFNKHTIDDENIHKYFGKLKEGKDIIFLLVGKYKAKNIAKDKNNFIDEISEKQKIEEIILEKFRERSEMIDFENMKKIKTILSNNNVIKDEITFPNEIYK